MTRFMRHATQRSGRELSSYDDLRRWSVEELEDFWASIWEFCGVRASRGYERVLTERRMPGAEWFAGAELNYAENMLSRRLRDEDADGGWRERDTVAVVHSSELRDIDELTWGELSDLVAAAAGGLRALGVGRGDRVVAYMPNIPETLIAFLATASIGAIWSSAAPEFGARSVIDRFAQIEPKVLLVVDGYRHGGKDFDRTAVVEGIRAELPTVEHTVVLGYLDENARLDGALEWHELLARGAGRELVFEQVPFDHPLWVLYSSGTTGLPKAIVQGHGGILVEQLKKRMHLDLRPGDRMFWFTTTGWMMWNFLVGCLLSDAAIVLYDGSPAYPDLGALWQLAESAQITCMGLSAGLIASCEKAGIEPGREHDLSALRAIGSTGSPLAVDAYEWIWKQMPERGGERIWIDAISGGTDFAGAFVAGMITLPVVAGEMQVRCLGAAVEAWSEPGPDGRGRRLVDEVGELVCTKPIPSMPLFFWNDEGNRRYVSSYFDTYPGVWRHGDWLRITPTGSCIIYGRSDATINRHGLRMGTSELYRAVEALPEVLDSLVVDLEYLGRESYMPLFVVLRDGMTLDRAMEFKINRAIEAGLSRRFLPNEILAVPEIPRTLSGKKQELPIKRLLLGHAVEKVINKDAMANPGCLEWYLEFAKGYARRNAGVA